MDSADNQKGQLWPIYHKKNWWRATLPFRYMEYDFPGDLSNLKELDLSKLSESEIATICKRQRLPPRCFNGKSQKQAKMCDIRHVGELDEHMKPLSYGEYQEIRRFLKEPYRLIVDLLWFANGKISDGNFISLESILTLKPCDVVIENDVDITCIAFHMSNSRTSHYFGHYLHRKLANEFQKHLNENFRAPFLFIFTDKYGGPIAHSTISSAIHRSAEQAKVYRYKKVKNEREFHPINSLHFRRCRT